MGRRFGFLGALLAALLPEAAVAADPVPVTVQYGADPLQAFALYRPQSLSPVPLILFVHGGGWIGGSRAMGEQAQPAHFTARGYAWATIDYRLVPAVRVEDSAEDVARALAWISRRAADYGIDPARIILMGHSSGANLAALVATDPQWLAVQGLTLDAIRAVVSLDGAGLDVVTAMEPGNGASHYHAIAFGNDLERRARLSPMSYAEAPNAPRWLFLHDADNDPSRGRFAQRLADALAVAGTQAQVVGINGTTHMGMIDALGRDGDPTTAAVDAFLAALAAQ